MVVVPYTKNSSNLHFWWSIFKSVSRVLKTTSKLSSSQTSCIWKNVPPSGRKGQWKDAFYCTDGNVGSKLSCSAALKKIHLQCGSGLLKHNPQTLNQNIILGSALVMALHRSGIPAMQGLLWLPTLWMESVRRQRKWSNGGENDRPAHTRSQVRKHAVMLGHSSL